MQQKDSEDVAAKTVETRRLDGAAASNSPLSKSFVTSSLLLLIGPGIPAASRALAGGEDRLVAEGAAGRAAASAGGAADISNHKGGREV